MASPKMDRPASLRRFCAHLVTLHVGALAGLTGWLKLALRRTSFHRSLSGTSTGQNFPLRVNFSRLGPKCRKAAQHDLWV